MADAITDDAAAFLLESCGSGFTLLDELRASQLHGLVRYSNDLGLITLARVRHADEALQWHDHAFELIQDRLLEPTARDGEVDVEPIDGAGQVGRLLSDAAGNIRAYVKGRSILAVIQGVAIGIAMAVLGVPLAMTISLVNIVGGFIPYLGGFVGGAFAVLMALSVGGAPLAILTLVIVLLISAGLENVLEPALFGNKLEMHPIVVLFATLIGGLVLGIVGMFLGAPFVAILRTVYRELRDSGSSTIPAPGVGWISQGSAVAEPRPRRRFTLLADRDSDAVVYFQ